MRSVILALALSMGLFVSDDRLGFVQPAAAQEAPITAEDACLNLEAAQAIVSALFAHPMLGMMVFNEAVARGDCVKFDTPEEIEIVKVVQEIPVNPTTAFQIVEVKIKRTGQTMFGLRVVESRDS